MFLEKTQHIGNQETDFQRFGAIFCMQPVGRNLQFVNKKVVLNAQPLANSVFSQQEGIQCDCSRQFGLNLLEIDKM